MASRRNVPSSDSIRLGTVGASAGATAGVRTRVAGCDTRRCVSMRARGSSLCARFSPGFDCLRQPSHFLLSRQEKVTKEKATRRWRRSDEAGSVPCAARRTSAGAKLGHPWPQTVAPFPDARLRCSAPTTGTEIKNKNKINSSGKRWIPMFAGVTNRGDAARSEHSTLILHLPLPLPLPLPLILTLILGPV
jgi:hypothetical protein